MATELATAYVSLVASTGGMKKQISQALGDSVKTADSVGQSAGSKMASSLGKTFKAGAVGAGAAVAGVLGTALTKGFARLNAIDQAQAKLKGLGNSAEDVSKIMDDAMASVKGTAFGLGDAATVAAATVAAGVKPGQDLQRTLKLVGDAATIAGTDMSSMGSIFNKVATQNKIQGDVLAQLGDQGIPIVQLLADEMGKTAEEVTDLASKGEIDFATFQNAMEAGMGGAALESGKTFQGALDNAGAALGRLGEAILDGPFKAAPGIIGGATAAIDGLTNKVKATMDYLTTGVEDKDLWSKAFGDPAQADAVMGTLDQVRLKWDEFFQGVSTGDGDGLFGTIGEKLHDLGQAAADAAPAVGEILESLGKAGAVAGLVSVTAILSALAPVVSDLVVPALERLADFMSNNQGLVTAFVTGFVGLKTIGAVAGPLGAVSGAFTGLSKGMKAAKMAMAVSGGTNLLGALKGFGTTAASSSPLLAKFGGVIKKLGSPFKGLVSVLKLAAGGFKALGLAIMANPIGAIVVAIVAVVGALVLFFTKTELGKKIWQGFVEFLGNAWQWIKDTAVTVWQGIADFFVGLWEGIKTNTEGVWNGIKEFFSMLWEGIKLVFSTAVGWVSAFLTGAWELIKTAILLVWEGIKWYFTSVWEGIKLIFSTAVGWVSAFLSGAWSLISSVVTTVWSAIAGFFAAVWAGIQTVFSTVVGWITSFLSGAWAVISGTISTVWGAITGTISGAWEAIKSGISNAVEAIKGKLTEWVNTARDKANEFIDKIQAIPGKVKGFFSDAANWLIQAGKDIINGLIDGIKSMGGMIGDAITSILPGIAQGMVSFFADGSAPGFAQGGVGNKRRPRKFAGGGSERHVAQIARPGEWRVWAEPETGGEAYIPLAKSKRSRSSALVATVADLFGYDLVDRKDGQPVSSKTPGGTGWQGDRVQFFAKGGIRTSKEMLEFARGKTVAGQRMDRPLEGAPYNNYPPSGQWGDCSYTVGSLAAFLTGHNPRQRNFATGYQESVLRSWGFTMGKGPAGSFRIGWYNGGPYGGHTASTLPNGTNAEMGGGRGNGQLGGGAAGFNLSGATNWAWMRPKASASTDVGRTSTGGVSGGASGGSDPNVVAINDENTAALGGVSTTESKPTTWSGLGAQFASDFVEGQIKDALGVFGIQDELPPIFQARDQLYAVDEDAKGEDAVNKEIADVAKEGAKETAKAPSNAIRKSEYKLGADFFWKQIAQAASDRRLGMQAAKIAGATMLVEVGDPPAMYASSVDTASLKYPHDRVGSDHDSSGLFQQRNNGAWGDVSQRMNPLASAGLFLNAMVKKFPNWRSMDPGAVAQGVQVSAYPGRYAGKMEASEKALKKFKGKLPGFATGGWVQGGSRVGVDDVLALVGKSEAVIRAKSAQQSPFMVDLLNRQGPQAVVDWVLNGAAQLGGLPTQGAPAATTADGGHGSVTNNFYSENFNEMQRQYRIEQAKSSASRIGAR